MRKIILFMHVSLDGFVCGPNGEQDWMTMTDDDMGKYLGAELLSSVDSMIMGRKLYEGFASFWPSMVTNPGIPQELRDFAAWMENTPKLVFSKTLDKADWKNSTLAKGTVAEAIANLKQQPGGDIVVFGGAGFVESLMELNLVDEYRLKLEPVVIGKGRSLWGGLKDRLKLELIKSKGFASGVVGLYYQPKR